MSDYSVESYEQCEYSDEPQEPVKLSNSRELRRCPYCGHGYTLTKARRCRMKKSGEPKIMCLECKEWFEVDLTSCAPVGKER